MGWWSSSTAFLCSHILFTHLIKMVVSSQFPHEISGWAGDKIFPPMSCLLAFGIRFWPAWLESRYLSAGPPREHCCSALKLDTVSTGFSFSCSSIFRSRFNISLTMEDVSQTSLTLTIHGKAHRNLLPDILLGEASSKVNSRSAHSFNPYEIVPDVFTRVQLYSYKFMYSERNDISCAEMWI